MKNIFYSLLILISFSCQSEHEKKRQRLKDALRNDLESYDRNRKVEVEAIYLTSLDTINQNIFDSLQMSYYEFLILRYRTAAKDLLDSIELMKWRVETYGTILPDFIRNSRYSSLRYKSKLYIDSSLKYVKLDTTLNRLINQRKNPPLIFRCNFLVKSNLIVNGEIEAVKSAPECFFDSDFNIIKLDKCQREID